MAAAVLLGVSTIVAAARPFLRHTPDARAISFTFDAPEKMRFVAQSIPVVSPDGQRIVFLAAPEGETALQLFVRPIGASVAQPLAGTEGASYPFWAPDSRFVGFFADGKLKKMDVTGGRPLILCDVVTGNRAATRGTWSRDGVILFNPSTYYRVGLSRVSASGGTPVPVTTPDDSSGEVGHRFPQFLPEAQGHFSPDTRWMAYTSNESGTSEVYVQAFPPGGGKWQVSTDGGTQSAWRADGREPFYLSADERITAVPVTTGTTFEAGVAQPLFQTRLGGPRGRRNYFVPSADGQRILVVTRTDEQLQAPMTVVVNWLAAARK
jgi:hypothetical protein